MSFARLVVFLNHNVDEAYEQVYSQKKIHVL